MSDDYELIVDEIRILLASFDPSSNRRYSKVSQIRVYKRPSAFDRGTLTDLHVVAWYPAVTGSAEHGKPFSMRLNARLVPTVWLTSSKQLVEQTGIDAKLVIKDIHGLRGSHLEQLRLGLRGDFEAIDRELDEGRKRFAEILADDVIRNENKRIKCLSPLELQLEAPKMFDDKAPDFEQRRRKIVEALLA